MIDKIGKTIRSERKALGLTQQALADLSETGLNFISQLERGKPGVRVDKVIAVLKILGLELTTIRAVRNQVKL